MKVKITRGHDELIGTLIVQTDETAVVQTAQGRLTVDLADATLEPYSDGSEYELGTIVKTSQGIWVKVKENRWRLVYCYGEPQFVSTQVPDSMIQNEQQLDTSELIEQITNQN